MNWFYNLNIRMKLLLGFIFLAITTGIVGFVGVTSISKVSEDDANLYAKMTVPLGTLLEISVTFQKMRVNARDMILANSDSDRQKYIKQAKDLQNDLAKSSEEFQKTIAFDDLKD